MPPTLFNPDPATTDRVLHRFADHEVSFHDIADEFKTTVPALVLWLAKPEIAQRIADLRSAGAERTRTIAALYLPRTIPVLMRIIDSHDHDIGHRLDDPRDPATPILKLRERESVRKAITLIYRLANFTGVPTPARAASSVASTSSRCPEPAEPTRAHAYKPASPLHVKGVVVSSPALPRSGTPGHGCPERLDPIGVVVASDSPEASTPLAPLRGATPNTTTPPVGAAVAAAHGYSLPPLRGDDSANSPLPDLPFGSLPSGHFASPSVTSRSSSNAASALIQRAGITPRRSRAGPLRQSA